MLSTARTTTGRTSRTAVSRRKSVPAIFVGQQALDQLAPLPPKTVRVYIASNITEFQDERDAAVEHVYPALREYCREKHGIEFQAVDLRVSVSSQAQQEELPLHLSLKEIKKCQKLSIGPSFVGFVGQKYGSRSLPEKISHGDYESLELMLTEADRDLDLLQRWYKKDENHVPSVYVLHPPNESNNIAKDEAQQKLRALLAEGIMACVEKGLMRNDTTDKYLLSGPYQFHHLFVTVIEEEINLGLSIEKPDDHCLVFIRNIEDLGFNLRHHKASRFIDLLPVSDEGTMPRVDEESLRRLKAMNNGKIQERLSNDNIIQMFARWSNDDGINCRDHSQYLNKFCDIFQSLMKNLIDRAVVKMRRITNPLSDTILDHLTYCKDMCKVFHGRMDLLQKIQEYINNDNRLPLVIHGACGNGKTSLVAKAFSMTPSWCKTVPDVIVRFASHFSGCVKEILHSILEQLAFLSCAEDTVAPENHSELCQMFVRELSVDAKRPLIVYIDGLDTLTGSSARRLEWLPPKLGKNVKLVLSTSPENNAVLNALMHRLGVDKNYIEVPKFTSKEAMDAMRFYLIKHGRTVTNHQEFVLADALKDGTSPLFMKMVYNIVSTWHSFTKVDSNRLPTSLKMAIDRIFENLEEKYETKVIEHVIGTIATSNGGLGETELEDVLSLDDDLLNMTHQHRLPVVRRIQQSVLASIYDDAALLFMTKHVDSTHIVCWSHAAYGQIARERYLKHETLNTYLNWNVAEYFIGTWGGKEKPFEHDEAMVRKFRFTSSKAKSDRKVPNQPLSIQNKDGSVRYNIRKMRCLPHHLASSGKMDDLDRHVLFNYEFLKSKLTSMSIQHVLDALMLRDSTETRLLAETIKMAKEAIKENIERLAVEISGRLLPLFSTNKSVHFLIRQCDSEGAKENAFIPVLQCFQSPGGPMQYAVDPGFDPKANISFSLARASSEEELVIAKQTTDTCLKIWNVHTGEAKADITMTDAPLYSLRYMNRLIHVLGCDDVISIYNVVGGKHIADINMAEHGKVKHMVVSKDHLAITIDKDGFEGPLVVDIETGLVVQRYKYPVNVCAFSADGKNLLCDSKDKVILHDMISFDVKRTLSLPAGGRAKQLIFRKKELQAFVSLEGDDSLSVYHLDFVDKKADGTLVCTTKANVSDLKLAPKEETKLLFFSGHVLYVLDRDIKEQPKEFSELPDNLNINPKSTYKDADFSFDDELLVALRDSCIVAWIIETGVLIWTMKMSISLCKEIIVSRTHNRVISLSGTNKIQAWNLDRVHEDIDRRIRMLSVAVQDVLIGDLNKVVIALGQDGEEKRHKAVMNMNTGLPTSRFMCDDLILKLSQDGRVLTTLTKYEEFRIWDVIQEQVILCVTFCGKVHRIVFSDDCSRLVVIVVDHLQVPENVAHIYSLMPQFGEIGLERLGQKEIVGNPFLTRHSSLVFLKLVQGKVVLCLHTLLKEREIVYKKSLADFSMHTNTPKKKADDRFVDVRPMGKNSVFALIITAKLENGSPRFVDGIIEGCLNEQMSAYIWNTAKDIIVHHIENFMEPSSDLKSISIAPSGEFAIDNNLKVFFIENGLSPLKISCSSFTGMAVIAKSKFIVFICKEGRSLRAVRIKDGNTVANLDLHATATCLDISNDDATVVIGCHDGRLQIFKLIDIEEETWKLNIKDIPSRQMDFDRKQRNLIRSSRSGRNHHSMKAATQIVMLTNQAQSKACRIM
ncbi:NACHT and WD repeat domain-containing protein 2-like [Lineus longissimus]|uniref:NACHT and WD repeat domain-containing protein 2-like n=1 Tax=Lineus longissimus TaxID=88925 RepID=UPI00315DFCB6